MLRWIGPAVVIMLAVSASAQGQDTLPPLVVPAPKPATLGPVLPVESSTPPPIVSIPAPKAAITPPIEIPKLTPLEVHPRIAAEPIKRPMIAIGEGEFQILINGSLTADFLYNTAKAVGPGTPFYLQPDSPLLFSSRSFEAHARQTALSALFTGPEVLDFQANGVVLVNFYESPQISDRYGLLPINAYGELKNSDWRIAAGYQMDVFNPINPTVLPFSQLRGSGNTGVFRGQFRVERFLNPDDETQITLTGAASEPLPTTLSDQYAISENTGLPNLEGRVAIGFGAIEEDAIDKRRPFEVGVSGVYGKMRTPFGTRRVSAHVDGLGADMRWSLGNVGLQGEVFTGQGLGTYGGGVLQNINLITYRPVRSKGLWIEGFYYWSGEEVHTHFGYGIDDPNDRDVGFTGPIRNETYYATTIWDMTKNFRVAFQISYLKTAYSVLRDNSGVSFHTQFQWKF